MTARTMPAPHSRAVRHALRSHTLPNRDHPALQANPHLRAWLDQAEADLREHDRQVAAAVRVSIAMAAILAVVAIFVALAAGWTP